VHVDVERDGLAPRVHRVSQDVGRLGRTGGDKRLHVLIDEQEVVADAHARAPHVRRGRVREVSEL